MSELRKIVLIIGNGFDLDLCLKTSDKDFEESAFVPYSPKSKAKVMAHRGFSLAGYTQMDLGIAKLHFELVAGLENFDWIA